MRQQIVLTAEQASILYDLVAANRDALIEQWAFGMYDGLLDSLYRIRLAGYALVPVRSPPRLLG